MKKFIKILTVFALTFMGATSVFAAVSDTFTAVETQAYTAEVKASATLEFTGGATDGDYIQIGDCVIDFDGNAVVDDNDCSDNSAVTATFATASDLNTFFDSLIGVSDMTNGHRDLNVVDVDGTHTQFVTAGTEAADGDLHISGANGNLSISSQTAGVVEKPQIITFTPANISSEGGVRFGANLGAVTAYYVTSPGDGAKEIVDDLAPNISGGDFNCTEDDVKIVCTATNDQTNTFASEVVDVIAPTKSGNIGKAVDENTSGVVVDIPNEITITDTDPVLTYSIDNTYRDWDDFSINSTTGELSFANPNGPDYENPTDTNVSGNNTYGVKVWVSDSAGNSVDVYVDINVNDVTSEAPIITSPNTVTVPENQTSVMQVVAHDDDGDTITYSLGTNIGAPDMSSFHIDSTTGVLTFVNAPDYENPTDLNNSFGIGAGDNVYVVVVQASDGSHTTTQNLFVSVTNVTGGHSGKVHSGKSGEKVCKDVKAINFSNVGQHDQSLCKYAEEVKNKVEEKKEGVKEKVEKTVKCSVVKIHKGLVRYGQRGQAVRDLQEYLNENGFNAGRVDGIFGKLTMAAVKRMQAKLGVVVDGVVGPQTRAAIQNCK